jgi:hypothetical protein
MFVLYSIFTFAWECLPAPPRRNDYPQECSCRIRNQYLPYHVSAFWARYFSAIPSKPNSWLRGHWVLDAGTPHDLAVARFRVVSWVSSRVLAFSRSPTSPSLLSRPKCSLADETSSLRFQLPQAPVVKERIVAP